MKRTTLILATLALTLGFVSCGKTKEKVKEGAITAVIVEPSQITLTLGETETAKLDVKWTPADVKATPEYTSEKPEVATVSAQGEVKAVAEGQSTITVKVGDKSATALVTVIKKGAKPAGGANELPILRFFKDDMSDPQKEAMMKEIAAYEAKLGRKYQENIVLQGSFKTGAFVSADLKLIPLVAYGLIMGEDKIPAIAAQGFEEMSSCEGTLKMIKENGFPEAEVITEKGKMYIVGYGKNDLNEDVSIVAYEQKLTEKGQPETNMFLSFALKKRMPDAEPVHPVVSDAKDFPTLLPLATKDVDAIKSFEATLGLRQFVEKESDVAKCNLEFMVPLDDNGAKIAKTNFLLVYYVGTPKSGPKFINSILCSVKNEKDFNTPEFKAWLKANGFDKDFYYSAAEQRMQVFNSDKSYVALALLNKLEDKDASMVMMQFVATKDLQKTSVAEIQKMAVKSLKMRGIKLEENTYESFQSAKLSSWR